VPARPHRYRAPAPEQRHGIGLLNEARGLGNEILAFKPRQLKGIRRIVDGRADQRLRALAHEACIRPIEQHDRRRSIGPREEPFNFGRLERNHGRSSRPGDEIGGQARSDVVGDHFGGAAFRIAQAAQAGEALLLAGNIVGNARKRLSRHDYLAGYDLGQ